MKEQEAVRRDLEYLETRLMVAEGKVSKDSSSLCSRWRRIYRRYLVVGLRGQYRYTRTCEYSGRFKAYLGGWIMKWPMSCPTINIAARTNAERSDITEGSTASQT